MITYSLQRRLNGTFCLNQIHDKVSFLIWRFFFPRLGTTLIAFPFQCCQRFCSFSTNQIVSHVSGWKLEFMQSWLHCSFETSPYTITRLLLQSLIKLTVAKKMLPIQQMKYTSLLIGIRPEYWSHEISPSLDICIIRDLAVWWSASNVFERKSKGNQ